ncbi:hypothetical protein [Arsenophonus apicola]|uniref:Uncharacterized protein n=1 Tax=Arsenophonus apicola TaxID=2879119 RepID=A0ABY8P646_9GAMM|nr:hypothetical protein [Arsenophonus apicola]WGO84712.1 hypothetical protein QG404_07580 [Arsenophonus apicola]
MPVTGSHTTPLLALLGQQLPLGLSNGHSIFVFIAETFGGFLCPSTLSLA